MKKFLLVIVILIFSLTSIILFNLRSAASTDEMLRLDTSEGGFWLVIAKDPKALASKYDGK